MKFPVFDDLKQALERNYPEAPPSADWAVLPELCPPEMQGDITVNCFRFASRLKAKPDSVADFVTAFLEQHPDIVRAEKVKAFVNVTLKPAAIHAPTTGAIREILASVRIPEDQRRRILVEYSAPNTNKPQHLGHVRNNTLGMSLALLLKRVGHDAIPVNLVNDRGIHICKSMIAYQRFGNGETPASTGKKGDHFVGDYYVRFNAELQRQLTELRRNRPEIATKSDEELFLDTEIGAAAQTMLQDWENGDPQIRKLWETMNTWVLEGFDTTYRRMGIAFARTYYESETYVLGKDIVSKGLETGTFFRRPDGAVAVDLGKKIGEKVVLRSDGTSVYITQDLGTTIRKFEDFGADRQIWVVGDEQILHFKQLFGILDKLGYAWAKELHHLSYGMVNLPSGKMKSREGTVVDADDLFDEMRRLAHEATLERCGDEIPKDIEERAEIIGMGALKFMLLKFNAKTTITFDPQASVKFEGDTGPYVQYACARINSIERKAREKGIDVTTLRPDWNLASTNSEKAIAARIALYPPTLWNAAERLDASVLVAYLLDLAKEFSRFYRECQVLNASEDALRETRLAICLAVRDILADGLDTLSIRVPDAM